MSSFLPEQFSQTVAVGDGVPSGGYYKLNQSGASKYFTAARRPLGTVFSISASEGPVSGTQARPSSAATDLSTALPSERPISSQVLGVQSQPYTALPTSWATTVGGIDFSLSQDIEANAATATELRSGTAPASWPRKQATLGRRFGERAGSRFFLEQSVMEQLHEKAQRAQQRIQQRKGVQLYRR